MAHTKVDRHRPAVGGCRRRAKKGGAVSDASQPTAFCTWRWSDYPSTPHERVLVYGDELVNVQHETATSRQPTAQTYEVHEKLVLTVDEAEWLARALIRCAENIRRLRA